MGTPINTPLTSEIWHLTIDDLLAPVAAAPCLGGPGPFVINLSASTAPISLPMKAVAEHPGTHLYQIQRTEDRRVRYRLRLGPFDTEAQAEALLPVVRELYPSAFAASAEPEDARAIESITTKIEAQQLAAVKAAMNKAAAAPLPNAARFGAARVAPAEPPPDRPPEPAPAALSVDGGALPAGPPAAWMALRTPRATPEVHTIELDFPRPVDVAKPAAPVKAAARERAASAPAFAPARFSPSARAFVPNAEFVSAPKFTSASTVQKPSPPASPAPRPAVTAAPPAPAAPEAAVAPMPAVAAPHAMPESLIPVLSDSMAVRPAPPAARASAASIPTLNVSAPPAATPAPAIAAPAPAAPVFPAAAPVPQAAKSPQPGTVTVPAAATPPPVAATPPPRRIEAMGTPLMSLDMTQTLRPLTPTELEDASVLRWFVIQLSCSEKAFDPDALPYLDIFTEYRLYSVSGLEQGKLMHALRLGFFSEESHAKAVAGYLGTFYENPLIKRVSAAERTRFAQHRVEARKDIGATGRHAIIEITDQRVIRPKRSGNPAAPPAMSPPPPPARGR